MSTVGEHRGNQVIADPPRKVGLWACIALVVANMIGVGVFTSLGFQVGGLPSGFVLLLLWVVGGVVALCGAFCYAELTSALPESGGESHFLGRIYHPAFGFMAGMVSLVAGFAAPCAIGAHALGEYSARAWPTLEPLPVAVGALAIISIAHLFTISMSAWVQGASTALKVILILFFLGAGLMFADPEPVRFVPERGDLSLIFSASFGVSLIFVYYAYSGWNAAAYIVGEVKDSGRTVARGLLLGTTVVMVLYVLLNYVFLRVAPMSAYEGQVEVGFVAGRALFGEEGARVMAALIALGLVSMISAMAWVGPRVMVAVGRQVPSLRWLGVTTPQGIPVRASLVQLSLAIFFVLTGTFAQVLTFAETALSSCAALAVIGVGILRWRRPHLPRAFRCPAYPLIGSVFLLLVGFTLWHLVRDAERQGSALTGFALLAVGLVIGWILTFKSAPRKS